jgi:hypothetical protein
VGIVWIGVFGVWICRGGWLAGVRVDDTELNDGRRVNGTTVGWGRGERTVVGRKRKAYPQRHTCGPALAPV